MKMPLPAPPQPGAERVRSEVVRRFVQQLGGHVSLESVPGRGSVFTVRLPSAGTAVAVAA